MLDVEKDLLSSSETLFGFGAWLTCRKKPIILSAHHNAAIMAALIKEFCQANNLSDPRENWTDNFIMPPTEELPELETK